MTVPTETHRRELNGPGVREVVDRYLAALITAVQFLTRLPISSRLCTAESLRLAPAFFPFVGTLIGCHTVAALFVAYLAWPLWIAVLLALSIEVMLTGALHEDGLADFCDAFGGGWQREDVLRILKDSRIGTYGTIGLVLALALRVACLVTMIDRYGTEQWMVWAAAVVAASGVGRWMIVLTMAAVPPVAERQTLMKDVACQISWKLFLASGLGVLPAVAIFAYLMPLNALLALVLIGAAWLWLVSLIRRTLQGITGDCLGCIGYVSHIMFLLAATARFSTS